MVISDFRVRPPFGGYLNGHVFRDRARTAASGSSYPFLPLAGALGSYRALPFRPDVRGAVLGGNAQRLLAAAQAGRGR
jgi:hypothetical protein